MALPRAAWLEARARIGELLSDACATLRDNENLRKTAIVQQADATMHLPATIGAFNILCYIFIKRMFVSDLFLVTFRSFEAISKF